MMKFAVAICLVLLQCTSVRGQSPASLPLLEIEDLRFEGAFRVPADEYGISSMNYAEGPLAYHPGRHSLYIVGHSHHQAIAEFGVPDLVASTDLAALNLADAPRQTFMPILDRAQGGNPEALDRIGGLAFIPGANERALMVNAYEYYDAPADNVLTSLLLETPARMETSAVLGYFALAGGAGHTSGWISPIPEPWQPALGGTYLAGQSSGIPIIGRASVGPSAFAFDPTALGNPTPTAKLLDFSLAHPLHGDLENASRTNDVWTHLSRAVYGLIVPGTRTYLTLGYSGGHASGVCYKCTQNDGTECGGYCAPDAGDYAPYYWLWDVSDLVAVREGRLESHAVQPYTYGSLALPIPSPIQQIGGATFDPASGLLYLTIQHADTAQGEYANPPVVAAFSFATGQSPVATERPQPPSRLSIDPVFPNPSRGSLTLSLRGAAGLHVMLAMYDMLGRRVYAAETTLSSEVQTVSLSSAGLPAGRYLVRAEARGARASRLVVVE